MHREELGDLKVGRQKGKQKNCPPPCQMGEKKKGGKKKSATT